MTKRKTGSSFDELLKNYYGNPGQGGIDRVTMDDLLANYYGALAPWIGTGRKKKAATVVLSLSQDDGEVLKRGGVCCAPCADSPGWEEYVVDERKPMARTASLDGSDEGAAAGSPPDSNAWEEYLIDVRSPLSADQLPPPPQPIAEVRAAPPPPDIQYAPPPPPNKLPINRSTAGEARGAGGEMSHEDLMADIAAIMSSDSTAETSKRGYGTKVEAEKNGSAAARTDEQGDRNRELPMPEAKDSTAIFDRIAKSMQYANAYDLGTVELTRMFDHFDHVEDSEHHHHDSYAPPAPPPRPAPVRAGAQKSASVDTADFLRDLESIRRGPEPPAYGQSLRDAAATAASIAERQSRYSEPLYDTGEHVLVGEDLYVDALRVGKNPGVLFSYGQIIAMGDFYESVDQMMNAEVSELTRLKSLIQRSTAYYKAGKKGADVSTDEWESATGGRYLKLAEENYEHFSPDVLFRNAGFNKAPNRFGDNKSAWEFYHQKAIEEAQKLFLVENQTVFPEYPLIVNAFGDHFLTDAFSSGHAVNKETIIRLFKANFFKGSELNDDGETFFKKVAEKAFRGELRRKFSDLETVDYPVCAWGWCFMWRPNIDSAERFSKVLIGAAEAQPDRVANVALKALHDKLNADGVQVSNGAGDGPWPLTGDGHLTPKTLGIMRKAVQQSIDNLSDRGILQSNLNFGPFYDRVWRYVPQLTAAAKTQVTNLAKLYTDPKSDSLVDAAAAIVTREMDSLIRALIQENKLKPA